MKILLAVPVFLWKILRLLFSRFALTALFILLQGIVLGIMVLNIQDASNVIKNGLYILSGGMVLWILNSRKKPAYQLAWIVLILLFPVFGGLFYLSFGGNRTTPYMLKKMQTITSQLQGWAAAQICCSEPVYHELAVSDIDAANQSAYLTNYTYLPVYRHSSAVYLASGEAKFAGLLEELEKAERFIFLEYFIIEEGYMWDRILEILRRKAAAGLDVRVIYDDIGNIAKLPFRYDKYLNTIGIKCRVFNPFRPILTARFNNRDHRKIVVIDGHTAFTGGVNIADEYINVIERFGHWKDSAIMVKGEAVTSFTIMFLSIWGYLDQRKEDIKPYLFPHQPETIPSDGYIHPFADSPLDEECISENVYLNLMGQAKRYIYIFTPYLVLDGEMLTGICNAAKRNIDVRIVVPHIPDKWYVQSVSRSYYELLVESGVKLYEYTPGFIHSKSIVIDDEYAVVGTINLDYRSLYLHFECGVWLYKCSCIADIKRDMEETFLLSQPVTLTDTLGIPWYTRLGRAVLRIFAPLL